MTKIQLRHDTAANFASVNPVLLAGEVGIETDTNLIKIGDGSTAYNSLDYFDAGIDQNRLHALKGYSDEGELLTDAEGLADVKSYAHSTFDSTKFTKVGSPIVTDDGIASGFSGSNYLDITNGITSLTKSFKVKSRFTYQSNSNNQNIFGLMATNTDNLTRLIIRSNGDLRFSIAVGSDIQHISALATAFTSGKTYDCECWQDSDGTMHMKYKALDENEWHSPDPVAQSLINLTSITSARIGQAPHNTSETFKGSIDLKQFSITVDGVPVFSGNKTGIDTIKPDNYTIVGSPTISADGVASGFGTNTYPRVDTVPTTSKNWTMIIPFKTTSDVTTRQILAHGLPASGTVGLQIDIINSNLRTTLSANGTSANILDNSTITTVSANKEYLYQISYNTQSGYSAKLIENGTVKYNQSISSSTSQLVQITRLALGVWLSAGTYPFLGSIDLNSFKIYVDGNLVYQPCLKIPYTKAINGEKVVNSVYRPRVNDMRQQFGFACYRTLSDTDYTLPQTSVYQNNQRFLLDSSRSGISYWELYSDRTLEQGGTCVSGVEYNLVKRFADDNYVLTIPYSSKTATSFIPSATGDFIAKGQGLL